MKFNLYKLKSGLILNEGDYHALIKLGGFKDDVQPTVVDLDAKEIAALTNEIDWAMFVELRNRISEAMAPFGLRDRIWGHALKKKTTTK